MSGKPFILFKISVIFIISLCACAFFLANPCEAADEEIIFIAPAPSADALSIKNGDRIILPDGRDDVIVETMADGRLKSMGGLTLSEKGVILEGPKKGDVVILAENMPTFSLKAAEPDASLKKADEKNAQVSIDDILTLDFEKELAKPEKTDQPEKQKKPEPQKKMASMDDILTSGLPDKTATGIRPEKKAEKRPEKAKTAIGQNMRIPKGAAKKKDLSFMAGCWSRIVPNPDGQLTNKECLCLNEKGRTGKAFYITKDKPPLICRATVNVDLGSDNSLIYSTKHEICSNKYISITGAPVYCQQKTGDLMCSWSVNGGRIGFKTFYYPFTKVESCSR